MTKQIKFTTEIPEEWHAALKKRAAESMRKIPAQLIFEAFEYHKIITAAEAKKGGRKP